jgi:hypothetical protein
VGFGGGGGGGGAKTQMPYCRIYLGSGSSQPRLVPAQKAERSGTEAWAAGGRFACSAGQLGPPCSMRSPGQPNLVAGVNLVVSANLFQGAKLEGRADGRGQT